MKFAVLSLMQWPQHRTAADVYRGELGQPVLAEPPGVRRRVAPDAGERVIGTIAQVLLDG